MTDDISSEGPALLATHDLKERGWTAALIRDFLGHHDATRPNLMRLGSRRRLPPVKLYLAERVSEAESREEFLVAQGRAMDARDRAERARQTRQARRAAQIEAYVAGWSPMLHPVAIRRGASRKAFAAHEDVLLDVVARTANIAGLTRREAATLAARLREKYVAALRQAYPWMESAGAEPARPRRKKR